MEKLKFFGEVLGLSPFKERMRQTKIALFGQEDVPGSKFGLSSLSQLHPKISPTLWRGKFYIDRKAILSNLVNHIQTPIENGWSVKRTQIRDFRGKQLTYDSHNGTDFAIPVGSTVCTAAAGEVVAIESEFNRGGLKIFIDHGNGLMTCYAHLARSLVQVGTILKRGEAIALSGYSGLDALIFFPLGIPHIHFNVWLNGEPIDPFPYDDKTSMWRNGDLPIPAPERNDTPFEPSVYDAEQVAKMIAICKTASVRERLLGISSLKERATQTIIQMNYYPTRFDERHNVYDKKYLRSPRLDMPFSGTAFDGVVFLDEL
ncbi:MULTISPECIES: M23 family metallopeptidase [unclassified Aureispira]|uniref:M23 family metallopeptidase n=1 Tax=unclassified Aureispira TaxID=2649989 RepID=UPI000698402C|nr:MULTISPECIES: M23 family metallopeptidase [unclassified Aureispira]WMX15737.1 M23 family metallopeptidase [Aureispira sp. CCB-E]